MSLIVSMPQCVACGAWDPFKCKFCGQLTCSECMHQLYDGYNNEIGCAHYESEHFTSTGWTENPPTKGAPLA